MLTRKSKLLIGVLLVPKCLFRISYITLVILGCSGSNSRLVELKGIGEAEQAVEVKWAGLSLSPLQGHPNLYKIGIDAGNLTVYQAGHLTLDTFLTEGQSDTIRIDYSIIATEFSNQVTTFGKPVSVSFQLSSNGQCMIDGRLYPVGTACTVSIFPGKHRLSVLANNSESYSDSVYIFPDRDTAIVINLGATKEKVDFTFDLNVSANVSIDQGSPLQGSKITCPLIRGEHYYIVSADGYETQWGSVRVDSSGQKLKLTLILKLVDYSIITNAEATIVVDGKQSFSGEEITVHLSPGWHKYVISAPGFIPREGSFLVAEGGPALNVPLRMEMKTFHKTYARDQDQIANWVEPLKDGGYLVCGQYGGGLRYWKLYLLKLATHGSVVWDRFYKTGDIKLDDNKELFGVCVRQIASDEILLLGQYDDGWILVSMDNMGTPRKVGTFEFTSSEKCWPQMIVHACESDVVIAAVCADGKNDANWSPVLIAFDRTNKLLWRKSYGGPYLTCDQFRTFLCHSGDNRVSQGHQLPNDVVLKVDPGANGHISNIIFDPVDSEALYGWNFFSRPCLYPVWDKFGQSSFVQDSKGRTVTVSNTDSDQDIVLKVGEGGEPVGLGGDKEDVVRFVTPTPDGGLIMAGGTKSWKADGWDIVLIKTDENGHF